MSKGRGKRRVFLVDDDPATILVLRTLLEGSADLMVCGTAGNLEGALAGILSKRPDLALIDLGLGQDSGLALIGQLRERRPGLPLLVYTAHVEPELARAALAAGANGYLFKFDLAFVFPAIRALLAGDSFWSPEASTALAKRGPGKTSQPLSQREQQVFALIGQGLDTKQIADRLGLSAKTITSLSGRMQVKLELEDFQALQVAAIQAATRHNAHEAHPLKWAVVR